jgi:plasmid stability protein
VPLVTLKIDDVPESLYRRLQDQAQRNQRSLAEEVVHVLDQALEPEKTLSILGLCGLGKEIWEGIDAAEYIRAERDSWDKE